MSRQSVGRFIGVTGAACAAVFWGFVVLSVIAALLDARTGWRALALLVAMPIGVAAGSIAILSVANVVVLSRRPDVHMPRLVAVMHILLAGVLLYMSDARAWLGASALLAVAATQVIAMRLFQMTPSQASSQR